jgi:serine protease Do
MSDFEYRPEDGYNEESVNENEVQVENVPVYTGQTPQDRYSYQSDPYGHSAQDDPYGQSPNSQRYYREGQYNNNGFDRDSYIPDEPVKEKKKKVKKKKKRRWFGGAIRTASFALIFGVVGGLAFNGVTSIKEKFAPSTSTQTQIETTTKDEGNASTDNGAAVTDNNNTTITAQDVSAVVDKVMPSVVSITGTYRTNGFFGTQESQGAGSGFIIADTKDKLMVATNNHVVADSSSLTVGFADGSTAPAAVVGKDSNADLAVISVDKKDVSEETSKKIKIATLGSSESLKVGEPVIAIGNALGYGQSVTTGVVSAKDREVSFTDGTMTLLQTDAAINPGNSGGVLINLKGEVVGINNAKLEDTSVEGMGYAIPITTANTVLNDLMNAGEISKEDAAYLGIVGKNIDASYSQALGMPKGVYVSQIVSGSPAEEAGISAGDIITGLDGNNVSTMAGLKEKLSIKKAGTKVTLTIKRANQNGEYEEKKVKVKLGKASDFQDAAKENENQQNNGQDPYNGQGNGQDNGNNDWNQDGNGFDNPGEYYDNGNGGNTDPFEFFFNN